MASRRGSWARRPAVGMSQHEGRLLTAVLSLGLGISLGRLLASYLHRKMRRTSAPDPVSESGKLIAAWRALESLEQDALFRDPFAAAVAGSAAVQQALQAALAFPADPAAAPSSRDGTSGGSATEAQEAAAAAAVAGAPAPADASTRQALPRRRFRYSNVAVRVWWVDRQLAAALSSPAQPRQVVLLGAGFDTRPWRLDLPPGVRWFEVDQPEVVAAKREQLQLLGAGFRAGADAVMGPASLHPLRAASWVGLGANLCQPGWLAALAEQGLNSKQPIVWVLEGLLMYLEPKESAALLTEMAAVSPRGSVLILHNSTQEIIKLIEEQGAAAYAPFPPDLVATWRSGFPPASDTASLAALLRASGWPRLQTATSRARIAAEVCSSRGVGTGAIGSGGSGGSSTAISAEVVAAQCGFETRPDTGRDRWAVFVVAGK